MEALKDSVTLETLDHFWELSPYIFRIKQYKKTRLKTRRFIHKEITFLYVISGKAIVGIEDKMLFLTAGDLVSINSYVSHSLEVAEPVKYVRIIIDNKFLNRNGFDPTGIVFDELIRDETVDRLIRDMMCEIGEKSETQRMMMNSLMLHLIGHLVRNYSRRADEESIAKMLPISREPTYKNIAVALEYVSANFASVITLDELSRVCGLSKFYFLKLFKKLIGMSPIEYINNVRCGYAKQMILNGSSITEAAFASGFNSTSYFSACFKKHKGCLPSSLIDGTEEN